MRSGNSQQSVLNVLLRSWKTCKDWHPNLNILDIPMRRLKGYKKANIAGLSSTDLQHFQWFPNKWQSSTAVVDKDIKMKPNATTGTYQEYCSLMTKWHNQEVNRHTKSKIQLFTMTHVHQDRNTCKRNNATSQLKTDLSKLNTSLPCLHHNRMQSTQSCWILIYN